MNPPTLVSEREARLRPALPDDESFIDRQLGRTTQQVKVVDLLSAVMVLAIGGASLYVVGAVLDAWIIPGGLGIWARAGLSGLAVTLAVAFVVFRLIPPLFRSVNPLYSAQVIEHGEPRLRNGLINFLLVRDRDRGVDPTVLSLMRRQTTAQLNHVHAESVVDRSSLIRLAVALLAIVFIACAYTLLSPRSPLTTVRRLAAPWADIPPPSRVAIRDIQPGNAEVFHGEVVHVTAVVEGLREDEDVELLLSTEDGQRTDFPLTMEAESPGNYHAEIPGVPGGIRQSLTYAIRAGDATSPHFFIKVLSAPTIVVDRVDYAFPGYTGLPPKSVQGVGDIKALEGTVVTIRASANDAIQQAHIDLGSDERFDIAMRADGKTSVASLTLTIPPENAGDYYRSSYELRFKNESGVQNPHPIRHALEVLPDRRPVVEILSPAESQIELPLNRAIELRLRARDDFALSGVSVVGEMGGRALFERPILEDFWQGQYMGQFSVSPQELKLKPGDTFFLKGQASDNRRPSPNRAETARGIEVVVTEPEDAPPGEPREQSGDANQDSPSGGEGNNEGNAGQGQGNRAGQGGSGEQEGTEGTPSDGSEGNGESGEQSNGGSGESQSEEGQDGAGEKQAGEQNQSDDQDGSAGESRPGQVSRGEDSQRQPDSASGEKSGSDSRNVTGSEPGPADSTTKPADDPSTKPDQQDTRPAQHDGDAFERLRDHFSGQSDTQHSENNGQRAKGEQENGSEYDQQSAAKGGNGDQAQQRGDQDPMNESGEAQAESADGSDQRQEKESVRQPGREGAETANEQRPTLGEAETGDNKEGDNKEHGADQTADRDRKSDGTTPRETPSQKDQPPRSPDSPRDDRGQKSPAGTESMSGEPGEFGSSARRNDTQAGNGKSPDGGEEQPASGGKPDGDETAPQAGETDTPHDAGQEARGKAGTSQDDSKSPADQSSGTPGDKRMEGSPSQNESDRQGQNGDDGKQPGDQQGSPGQASGQPGDGSPGQSAPRPGGQDPNQIETPVDQANLEYARQATNLVLDRLKQQADGKQPDEALLKKLGWSADQLREFVRRWEELRAAAQRTGGEGDSARREFDRALLSLGLTPGGTSQAGGARPKDTVQRLQEGLRIPPPTKYQEAFRAFQESISRPRTAEESANR